jgi:hypothetical protein
MARLRHTAWKSVIPFLPSRLVERPLRRPVTGQSSHLERLHHRLHEEHEHRRQEQEQQGYSFSLQQEIEYEKLCWSVLEEISEDVHLFSVMEEFYTLFLCCKICKISSDVWLHSADVRKQAQMRKACSAGAGSPVG